MHLLTSEDAVSACRPLSRICAVLYGEFAPIFMEHGASDVCSAMMRRLLLSLQHPEAPFVVQCVGSSSSAAGVHTGHIVANTLPAGLAGLLLPTHLCFFFTASTTEYTADSATATTSSTSTSSKKMLDLLCLQGCYLPFRVKQDHIGAVSLLKVVTAICNVSEGTSNSKRSADVKVNILQELPRILQCLKEVHDQAQGDLSYAILLFQQHQQHRQQQQLLLGADTAQQQHPLLLLRYCYFYLTFLQSLPR